MGLFSKTQKIEFTPWPDPQDKADNVYKRAGRDLRLLEEPTFAPVIEALAAASGNAKYLLGRVTVMGDQLVVDSWGQTIGRIQPKQAAQWRGRIRDGWAFGYYWISNDASRGWHVKEIHIDEDRLT